MEAIVSWAGENLASEIALWGERAGENGTYWESLDLFVLAWSKKIPLKVFVWAEGRGLKFSNHGG